MPNIRKVKPENITRPIESLECYFRAGGVTLIQAAFSHSFFIDPDSVREKTPMYPDRARYGKTHYPGLSKGKSATWSGDGRSVVLDDNQYAQNAWQRYTRCPIQRGSGYGLRHIWGHPWDPDAFTAGWNFCYMPFWAGMLTEDQHPLTELQLAIKQTSWELYFRDNEVCDPPDFVIDPGADLRQMLGEQPILIMGSGASNPSVAAAGQSRALDLPSLNQFDQIKAIRAHTNRSWTSIYKGVLAIQGMEHEPFGTTKVEATTKSIVQKILSETRLAPAELQSLLESKTQVNK